MELNYEKCDVCCKEEIVLNAEDSKVFIKLIYEYFRNEIDINSNPDKNWKICLSCIYKLKLIDSNKEILTHIDDEKLSQNNELNDSTCTFCLKKNEIFKMQHKSFLRKLVYLNMKEKEDINVCPQCYFIIEAGFNFKKSLEDKITVEESNGIDTQQVVANNIAEEGSIAAEITDEILSQTLNETSAENISNNSEKLSNMDTEVNIPIEDCDDNVNKNNSLTPTKTGEKKLIHIINNTKIESPKKNESPKKIESPKKVTTPEVQEFISPRTLRKKLPSLPSPTLRAKKLILQPKQKSVLENNLNKIEGFNVSKIKNFIPLCKMNLQLDCEICKDNKMYKSVPFVKVSDLKNLKKQIIKPKINKKMSKRTPPIKIKLKNKLKLMKKNMTMQVKKTTSIEQTKDEASLNDQVKDEASLIDQFQKKKVVINLIRFKLPIEKTDDECLENDKSPEKTQIEELNESQNEEKSPKIKKHVRFNDTLTYIVEVSSDEETIIETNISENNEDISEKNEEISKSNGHISESDEQIHDIEEKSIAEHCSNKDDHDMEEETVKEKDAKSDLANEKSPTKDNDISKTQEEEIEPTQNIDEKKNESDNESDEIKILETDNEKDSENIERNTDNITELETVDEIPLDDVVSKPELTQIFEIEDDNIEIIENESEEIKITDHLTEKLFEDEISILISEDEDEDLLNLDKISEVITSENQEQPNPQNLKESEKINIETNGAKDVNKNGSSKIYNDLTSLDIIDKDSFEDLEKEFGSPFEEDIFEQDNLEDDSITSKNKRVATDNSSPEIPTKIGKVTE